MRAFLLYFCEEFKNLSFESDVSLISGATKKIIWLPQAPDEIPGSPDS